MCEMLVVTRILRCLRISACFLMRTISTISVSCAFMTTVTHKWPVTGGSEPKWLLAVFLTVVWYLGGPIQQESAGTEINIICPLGVLFQWAVPVELLQCFNRYNLFGITKAMFQSVWQLPAWVEKGEKKYSWKTEDGAASRVQCFSAISRVTVNTVRFRGKIRRSYETSVVSVECTF